MHEEAYLSPIADFGGRRKHDRTSMENGVLVQDVRLRHIVSERLKCNLEYFIL